MFGETTSGAILRLRTGLARLLRPDLHPVLRLLQDNPLTVPDILARSPAPGQDPTPGPPPDSGVSMEPLPQELSIDQQLALRTAATRLRDEFEGVFSTETIERFLHHSYEEFANRDTIQQWLPLLAERFARQRLTALSRVEGTSSDTRPLVLFLCVHNAGRSQMAMGFFQHLAGDDAIAWSGGSEPAGLVNPAAVEAMAERGIDISRKFPKPWTDEVVRAADVVVTMGCGDACPVFPGKRYEDWELDDPAGRDLVGVRPIRDDIERRVRALLESLRLRTGPHSATSE